MALVILQKCGGDKYFTIQGNGNSDSEWLQPRRTARGCAASDDQQVVPASPVNSHSWETIKCVQIGRLRGKFRQRMYPPVVTKDPTAVEVEVQAAHLAIFPGDDKAVVPQAFGWVIACFTGNYKDYQKVDAPYHDLEHTLQATLCMARL